MKLHVYIINDSPVKVWGLTPAERTMKILGDRAVRVNSLQDIPSRSPVLILRGDYLIDDRLINFLADVSNIIVVSDCGKMSVPFAAGVPAEKAVGTVNFMENPATAEPPENLQVKKTEELPVSFNKRLRKFEPPFVFEVKAGQEKELEKKLFDWSYKGVTDLVTKWLWPAPARRAVKKCVQFGLRPNHVTAVGFLLVLSAGWLFYRGDLWAGLFCGWLMTFLDTVDGKLARVTVTSSRFGHYFDHLIDLIHPPFWYLLWGIGLQATGRYELDIPLSTLMWLIFSAYIAGRLVEGTFKWTLGRFGIFCWKPVDSFFRLITARRNPCMIILTLSLISGRPDIGLLAVALWTALTTAFMILRLLQGLWLKYVKGETLESWFSHINPDTDRNSLAVRWFTRDLTG